MANVALNVVVGGEEKAKQAIKDLNGSIKTLDQTMKTLDEAFAGNQNSYDYLQAKLKNLTETQEAYRKKTQELPGVIEFLRDQQKLLSSNTDELKQKMEQATAAYDNAENKTAALRRAMNEATREFNDNQKALNYARDEANSYSRQLIEAEGKVDALGEEIRKTNTYLGEAATSADGTANSIDRFGREVRDAGEDTKSFASAAEVLAQAIVASGAVQGAEKLRDAIVATAKASIEYESAFAGVRKTVDGTAEELQTISDGIRQMSLEIPMASKELAGIAENAGQLGIATGDILNFTETIAAMSVTTNLSADEAASSLAKFANITNMSADNYSNLGSSIVALGNNFATTEADIVAMATRLASTGEIVGLTEPQILAVATALSSVGIEAEAGGSAFSKLLKTIESSVQSGGDAVADYAKIAGMSAEQFAAAWRQDAVAAVAEFVDGLGRLDEQGGSAITVLNDLGLNEVRLSNAVLALSTAEGLLSDALETSNRAWAENTALANEAAVRYETTESRIQILNNAFNNLKITVGDELLNSFGGAIDGLTDLTVAAEEFVRANPEVVAGLTAVAAGIGGLAVAGTVIPLISQLWGLLSANPVGLAISTVVGLATAFGTLAIEARSAIDAYQEQADSAGELIKKTDELRESFGNTYSEILSESQKLDEAIDNVERLGNKTELAAEETQTLEKSTELLNSAIPGLKLSYDNLGISLDETIIKLRLLADISGKSAESSAIGTHITELTVKRKELNDEIEQTEKDLAAAERRLAEMGEFTLEGNIIDLVQDNVNAAVNGVLGFTEDAEKAVSDLETKLKELRLTEGRTASEIDELIQQKGNLDVYIDDANSAAQKALDELKSNMPGVTAEVGKLLDTLKTGSAEANELVSDINTAISAGFSEGLIRYLSEGGNEAQAAIGKIVAELERLTAQYGEDSDEVKAFVSEWNDAWAGLSEGEESLNTFINAEKEAAKAAETAAKEAEQAAKKISQESAKATEEAQKRIGESLKNQAKDVKTSLDTLTKEYNNVYNSTKSALDGIGGLFGEVAFKAELSIEDMIRGLETQADYMVGYMQNIQRAAQIGLDEGLVAALSDGSDESAGYIQKIITEFNKLELEYGANSEQAQDFVTRFNDAFRGSETAKDTFASNVAEMSTNFTERKDAILKDAQTLLDNLSVYSGDSVQEVAEAVWEVVGEVEGALGSMTEAVEEKGGEAVDAAADVREEVDKQFEGTEEVGEEAGENYVKGIVEGIDENTPLVVEAGKRIANTLEQTVNSELDIRSPSKVGRQQGEFYDEGIALGIEDNTDTVVSGAINMISDLVDASESAAKAAGQSIGGTIAAEAAQELGRALREAAEKGELTYNGNKVGTAANAGIPNLSGQAAADWNAQLKAQYGLPSNWTNQDITDWLNGGGFLSGGYNSSSTATNAAKATSAVKQLSSTANIDRTVNNSHYYDAVPSPKYTAVTVNQTFNTPTATPYQTKTAAAEGIKAVLY